MRKWVRDYTNILYTWILYHYPVGPSEAKVRTLGIFREAYSQLDEFNPADSSMYAWLIGRAESFYPDEKQEAAGAGWSDNSIEAEDLRTLAMVGSQEVPEALLEHPVVVRLIQAALTEMDESERLVLLRRYHRIDRKATIGLDLGFSADLLGDKLVRARYYFRRYLFARIHFLRQDIGDFTQDIRITVFEKNLEKIFCSIPPFLKLPDNLLTDLENNLLEQIEQIRQRTQNKGSAFSRKSMWTAGGVLLILAAGIVVVSLFRRQPAQVISPSSEQNGAEVKPEPAEKEAVKTEMSQKEMEAYLMRIFDAGATGDIEALLTALEEGPFPAQVAAAIYLGRIGDASAIGPLEKAAQRWYPDSMEGNPFLTAIEQIEQRLRLQAEEEAAAAEEAAKVQAEETEPEPMIEENILPSEPNLPGMIPEAVQLPAEVNETPMEIDTISQVEEPNVFGTEEEVWEPNSTEAEWPEGEMETGEVEYVEGAY